MLTHAEITTYRDLFELLKLLTPQQLDQKIQYAHHQTDDSKPVELMCVIGIGTVGDFGFSGTRSIYDNKYHAEDVVLLGDWNPFAPDGAVAYTWVEEANADVPEYGPDGPTKREDQMAQLLVEVDEK